MWQAVSQWLFSETAQVGPRTVQIDRRLGVGGFSTVYLVHDVDSMEPMALKRMLCIDEEHCARAQREIRLQRSLRHPHILPLEASEMTDMGAGQAQFDLLFPYYANGTLEDVLDRCVRDNNVGGGTCPCPCVCLPPAASL